MEKIKNFFVNVGKKVKQGFYNEFVGTWKGITKENISFPILLLVVINVVALIISNIIAARSFEIGYINNGIRFALPIGVILYPLVLTISDVLAQNNWVWTRRSCHLGFLINLVVVIVFEITMAASGGRVNGDFAILSNSFYLLIASFLSFYFGDLLNDTVFRKLKNKDGEGNGKLVKRCVLSTIAGQIIDASIFIILGMHVFPCLCGDASLMSAFSQGHIITSLADPIGWANVGIMIGLQIIVKVLYEFALSPLIIFICTRAKKENQNIQ